MRVAMIGQRGVPATFGGIERAVEELGAELARRGHEVVVFGRKSYTPARVREWRGIQVCYVPAASSKHLETFVHAGLATARSLTMGFDVTHYHALGPGLFAPVPRWLGRTPVVQTVHGLDYERDKWSNAASRVLRVGGWMSARVPNATVVVSRELQDHYRETWNRATYYIPNGVQEPAVTDGSGEILRQLGLRKHGYALFVGRLTPEKAPDLLVRAFRRVRSPVRLVVVGGSSHSDTYVQDIERVASEDPRIVLAGYVYGDNLTELYANAGVFVLPSSLEGLPLVLLEAASHAVPIIASDIGPHRQVLGADGPGRRWFPTGNEDSLVATLEHVLSRPDEERIGATSLRDEVLRRYRWEENAAATESLYLRVVSSSRRVVSMAS